MALVKADLDEVLAARLRGLARASGRTVAAELRRAVRAWVDADGRGGVPVPVVSSPPPPVLPTGRRTMMCVHRRPVSSFCRYCDA